MFVYKKIIVVGCCGSGKSTFAKKLAEKTGLPLYLLDNIYWFPDASHLERPEFIKRQNEIMKNDRWIIDGNYGSTIKHRIKECELVFFFDLPTDVCLKGVVQREKVRDDIACELEPDKALLDYIINYNKKSKPKLLFLFMLHPRVKVISFKSHKEADDYLSTL
ncbi:MAG: adenylate kinase [Eubacterium sp.]|nr:adenylate kinase [Eubacterium sp.]